MIMMMKRVFLFLVFCLLVSPSAFAVPEEDVPTADGAPTQWTNGFAAVDETVAGFNDADFIVATTAGWVEIYTFAHTVPDVTVNSVTVNYRCMRVSGGAAATYTVAAQIERSNTASTGTGNNVSTAFAPYTDVWNTCPVATCTNGAGGAWTKTDLDNLEFGVNAVAKGSKNIQCSQTSITVDYTSSRRRFMPTTD